MTNLRTILIIQQTVEDYFSLQRWETDKKSHLPEIVQPRQVVHFFCAKHTAKCSKKAIGQIVGNRDSGTVFHSIKTIKGLMDVSASFSRIMAQMEAQIKEKLHDINHVLS